jgi:hypothetical protein
MYALYSKQQQGTKHKYLYKKDISLFGCNKGYIPSLLKTVLSNNSSEPLSWHINIEQSLNSIGHAGDSLIINLKPNSKTPNLSLYEVCDVWGYSDSGWTPIMLYLRGLFVDEDPTLFNSKDFARETKEIEDPIFSLMYLAGTVRSGVIEGKWTTPRPSSTNSLLLWPEKFEYFANEAKKIMATKK